MQHPPWKTIRRRYAPDQGEEPERVSLTASLAGAPDPWRLLPYLADLGRAVATLDDLVCAIAGMDDEEELAAFRCAEGVAVTQASDGRWLLFTP